MVAVVVEDITEAVAMVLRAVTGVVAVVVEDIT
jgi:phenylpyruvate tautomerase PptA (4-oxalocrotonate tautomerase family)